MIKLIKNLAFAFLYDEAAAKRWLRAASASLAITVATVIPFSGTDPTQAITVIRGWTFGDWAIRLALGFLFSSVHGGAGKAAEPSAPAPEPKP